MIIKEKTQGEGINEESGLNRHTTIHKMGFPGGSAVKNQPAMVPQCQEP